MELWNDLQKLQLHGPSLSKAVHSLI
jgi:hypothetical protein